jgi:DNA polymerase
LFAIATEVAQCQKCGLHEGRKKTVFGIGVENPEVLIVGEGPGYYEDLSGEPFVGRAGQLLSNALATVGLSQHSNSYIANVVKCRAAEAGKDRRPSEVEVAACKGYLEAQIAHLKPRAILALGATAATTLLDKPAQTSVQALRHDVHHYQPASPEQAAIPLVVSYHPAYLLRNPTDKALFWNDLCTLQSVLSGS